MPNMIVAFELINEFRNDAVVQWRRIEVDGHAGDERHQQAGRQSEGMEYRQRVEDLVAAVAGDARQALGAVRERIAV